MFSFRQLECFVVVAEELHYGRAAARLRIGQPPLSQQIRRLETDLSVNLFKRTRRSVELTEAGRVFLAQARSILETRRRSMVLAQRAARGELGVLRLALVPGGEAPVLAILRRFAELRPEISIEISILTTTRQLEALRGGAVDAGFLRPPAPDKQLGSRIVARESLIVAVPRRHPLARPGAVAIRDLSNQPMILFPRRISPDYYDKIVSLFQRSGASLNVVQDSEHVQTTLSLIAAGFGLSVFPESIRVCSHEDVVYQTLSTASFRVETALVWRSDQVTEALQELLRALPVIQKKISQGT
ncbi:MAG TPA: LysR family transcriptional regulator [Rhizomicrobium sp.]|nr:LysR family transcriptional regulator [Rhizomicrobium sp.]